MVATDIKQEIMLERRTVQFFIFPVAFSHACQPIRIASRLEKYIWLKEWLRCDNAEPNFFLKFLRSLCVFRMSSFLALCARTTHTMSFAMLNIARQFRIRRVHMSLSVSWEQCVCRLEKPNQWNSAIAKFCPVNSTPVPRESGFLKPLALIHVRIVTCHNTLNQLHLTASWCWEVRSNHACTRARQAFSLKTLVLCDIETV